LLALSIPVKFILYFYDCRLLYAVFVVSSENATVAELAKTLQADLYQLQAAASFACRLGWAVKLLDPDSVLRDSSAPAFPTTFFVMMMKVHVQVSTQKNLVNC
jgi:hypothetical protein